MGIAAFIAMLALAPMSGVSAAQAKVETAQELAQVQQLFRTASYLEAERRLVELVAKDPSSVEAWNMLGSARHAQKRYDTALEAFEHALELKPSEVGIRNNVGVCRFALQDYDGAREAFARSVADAPSEGRPHMFLARIAAAKGESAVAEREFAAAIGVARPDPLAFLYQGLFFYQDRRLDEARGAFERAIELDPDLPGAHLNLALVLQRLGDAQRAEVHMRRFRELSDVMIAENQKRVRVAALVRDTQREIESGNLDAALASALAVVKEAPEVPLAHSLLGQVYLRLGRAEDGARSLETAKRLAEASK